MEILAQARDLGAVVNSNALCLPAASIVAFLQAAADAGFRIRYIECLYFYESEGAPRDGTESSMELSCDVIGFPRIEDFIAEARRCADEAIKRASRKNIRPFFEVGLDPHLDLKDSQIKVRR